MSWTRESLMLGSALMKLLEGREECKEAPPATAVEAPATRVGVWCPCPAAVRSPEDRLADCAVTSLPVSSVASSVLYFFRGGGRLTVGLFPRGPREGACKRLSYLL